MAREPKLAASSDVVPEVDQRSPNFGRGLHQVNDLADLGECNLDTAEFKRELLATAATSVSIELLSSLACLDRCWCTCWLHCVS